MDVEQLANQLNVWIDATQVKIAQYRYLAQLEVEPEQKDILWAQARRLEFICEETQACIRLSPTLRQLRRMIQGELHWIQQGLDRSIAAYLDEGRSWVQGEMQAYSDALHTLRQIVGL